MNKIVSVIVGFCMLAYIVTTVYCHDNTLKNLQTQIEYLQKSEKEMKEFKEKQKIVNQNSLAVFDSIIQAIKVTNYEVE